MRRPRIETRVEVLEMPWRLREGHLCGGIHPVRLRESAGELNVAIDRIDFNGNGTTGTLPGKPGTGAA